MSAIEERIKTVLSGIEHRPLMYGSNLEAIEMQYLLLLSLLYPKNLHDAYQKFSSDNKCGSWYIHRYCANADELMKKLVDFKENYLLK